MVLFSIEYEVPNGMTYICKVIGNDETDVMDDLVSQVGRIRVISIYRVSEVHRITGTVRKSIIEGSLVKQSTRGKGRPRKLDFWWIFDGGLMRNGRKIVKEGIRSFHTKNG